MESSGCGGGMRRGSFGGGGRADMGGGGGSFAGGGRHMYWCRCGHPAVLAKSGTIRNPGRRFWGCSNWRTQNCGFFLWLTAEEEIYFGFGFNGDDGSRHDSADSSSSTTKLQGGGGSSYSYEVAPQVQAQTDWLFMLKLVIGCIILGIFLGFVLSRL